MDSILFTENFTKTSYGYINEYWYYENIDKETYPSTPWHWLLLGTCMLRKEMELRYQEKLNFIVNVSNLYEIWDLVGVIDDNIDS